MPEDSNFLNDLGRYGSARGWEPPDEHKKTREKYRREHPPINPCDTMLDLRTASEWMTKREESAAARSLFGDMWKEGEISILFSDTGLGKSIIAVQIAELIAASKNSPPYEGGVAAASADGVVLSLGNSSDPIQNQKSKIQNPAKVLYLDFEHSSAQFAERYSCESDNYQFSPFFFRTELEWDGEIPAGFRNDLGHFMAQSISLALEQSAARILIIDNISYLSTSNTSTAAALKLMRALKAMKSELDLSILVLAHTPKRVFAKPLSINHLAGSRMLANFADTVFALGMSRLGRDIRYLKQIKSRSRAIKYDDSKVLVLRLERVRSPLDLNLDEPDTPFAALLGASSVLNFQPVEAPFLGFRALGHSSESVHLPGRSNRLSEDDNFLMTRHLAHSGLRADLIALVLGIPLKTVRSYLRKLYAPPPEMNDQKKLFMILE